MLSKVLQPSSSSPLLVGSIEFLKTKKGGCYLVDSGICVREV